MACKRKQWSVQSMEIAVASVKDGTNGLREAARLYNLPVETLRRRVNDIVPMDCRPGPSTVLLKEEEDRLYEYLLNMSEMGYGLNRETVMKLAFTIAEKTGKSHPFQNESAGRAWFDGFKRRYPRLTIRTPQPLSQIRALSGNQEIISDFFGKLGALYGRLNLLSKPMLIYNADETGISVVHKPGKVVTELGRRHVYSVVSGERGKNHTIMTCVSASGNVLPPMMIFPRKRAIPDSFKIGAVPNTLFLNSTNGWINSELYLEWLKFFRNNIPPTRPVLLIQDGHTSHMSIEAIEYCKSNEIYILCLPSHTTHILQPLDIGVFKSFKHNFSKACTNYMSKNPGRVITPEFLASLVAEAWYVSLTHLNIMSGFRKSGLFPFNPSMVNDRCTAPSKVFEKTDTDVPLPSQVTPPSSSNSNSSSLLPNDVAPISSVNVYSPVATTSQTDASLNDSSNDKELFTEEQEKLFNKRFEEGYDLYDPLFVTWLKIRHPHRCVSVSSDTLSEGTTTTCDSTSVTSSTISTVSSSTRSQSDTLSEILVLPTAVRSSTCKKKVESLNRQAVCLTDLLDDLKLKEEEKKRVLEEKQLNAELKRKEREEKRNQKEEEKRKKEEDKKKKEEEKKKKEEEKEELKRKKEEEKKKREEDKKRREEDKKRREEEKKKREEDKKRREEEKRRKEEEKKLKEQSKKKHTKQLQEKTESDSCPICGVMYDDVSGLWIQCDVCDEWIDFQCTELSDKDKLPETYVCQNCGHN